MKQLRDILPVTLQNLGLTKRYNTEWAMLHWPEIVGRDIAAHAVPVNVQKGTIVLAVNNSVWCHHLSMMKEEIIDKLNGFIGEKLITDIRFQAGYLQNDKNINLDNEKMETINQKLKLVKLDEAEIEQAGYLVRPVAEEQLQRKLFKIIKKHLAFKKLKKLNNWHKCAACDSLCPGELTYCSVCAIEHREKRLSNIRQLLIEAPWLTYAELCKYAECLPEEFIRAKTALILFYTNEMNSGNSEKLDTLTLVMLVTGAKPGDVTEKLMKKTLDKFRRKNYVPTPRL